MTKAREGKMTEEPRWEGKTLGEARTGGSQTSSYAQQKICRTVLLTLLTLFINIILSFSFLLSESVNSVYQNIHCIYCGINVQTEGKQFLWFWWFIPKLWQKFCFICTFDVFGIRGPLWHTLLHFKIWQNGTLGVGLNLLA